MSDNIKNFYFFKTLAFFRAINISEINKSCTILLPYITKRAKRTLFSLH